MLMSRLRSSSSKAGQVWAPEGSTAFKCLVSARFCAALLSNISDCDETFNYWEPVSWTFYLVLSFRRQKTVNLRSVSSDSLPAVRERDADVGIFPRLRHSLLCLPVAARSSCLLSRQDTSNQQGRTRKGFSLSPDEQHPKSHQSFSICFWRCCLILFYFFRQNFSTPKIAAL